MRGLDRIGSVIINFKAYANSLTILVKLLIQFISRFKRFESSCWRNQKETFFFEMHFVWTFNGWSDLGLEIHELVCCHEFIFFIFLIRWICEIKIAFSNPELISTLMVKENPKCVDGLILEAPAFKLHEATAAWYIVLGKN